MSDETNSGNSLVWIVVAGCVVLFCLLPIGGLGIVGMVYWLKPAPNDQGAGLKPDELGKPKGDEPKNERPAAIAERVRFNADFANAGDARRIYKIFLSRDGKRAAITNGSKTQIWDIFGELKKLQEVVGTCHAMSPDGKLMIIWKQIERFKANNAIVDAATGVEKVSLGLISDPYFYNENYFWTLENFFEGRARLSKYDSTSGKRQDKFIELPAQAKADGFGNIRYLNDRGEVFYFFRESAEHHVWDTNTEKWARKTWLKIPPGEHISQLSPVYSPDGEWLVAHMVQNGNNSPLGLTVFSTLTGVGTKLPRDEYWVGPTIFVPGANLLLLQSRPTNDVVAYDVKSNAVVGSFGTVRSISFVAVSADGGTLAAGTGEGQVVIWDLKKLK
jgi:WD40 repeat protein